MKFFRAKTLIALLAMSGASLMGIAPSSMAETKPLETSVEEAKETSSEKAKSRGSTGRVTFVPDGKPPLQKAENEDPDEIGYCPLDPEKADDPEHTLQLLVPEEGFGLTVEAHPTLMAYVPPTTAPHLYVKLYREEDGAQLYQSTIPLLEEFGFVSIPVPPHVEAMEFGKRYVWSVSMKCEDGLLPKSPYAEAVIQRVDLDLPLVLGSQTPLERAELLGQSGVWYDMVSWLYTASEQHKRTQFLKEARRRKELYRQKYSQKKKDQAPERALAPYRQEQPEALKNLIQVLSEQGIEVDVPS